MSLPKTFAGPSAEGGAAAPIDVKVAVARFSTPTSTGNQDWTTTDLGGKTPKAAMIFGSMATADATAADHIQHLVGFTDFTRENATAIVAEHNVATSNTRRVFSNTSAIYNNHPTSPDIVSIQATASAITNGIRLNFTTVEAAAKLYTVVFFAGADLSVYAGIATVTTQDVAVDVTAPGFEPDIIFATFNGRTGEGRVISGLYSFGVAVNDGSDTQRALEFWSNHSTASEDVRGKLATNGAASYQPGVLDYILVSDFDASGFSVTLKEGGFTADVRYLALNLGGLGAWAGSLDSPTSTGDWSVTSPGFTPQIVGLAMSMLQAEDSNVTTADAGSHGLSVVTPDAEFSVAIAAEDAVTTMNNQSLSDNTAVHLTNDAGTQSHLAAYSSMDTLGWTYSFSATDGTARKWFGFAIEAP